MADNSRSGQGRHRGQSKLLHHDDRSLPIADVPDVLNDVQEVNNMWRGLGYYRRAKNLLLGSQRIMNDPKRYQGASISSPCIRMMTARYLIRLSTYSRAVEQGDYRMILSSWKKTSKVSDGIPQERSVPWHMASRPRL